MYVEALSEVKPHWKLALISENKETKTKIGRTGKQRQQLEKRT